MSDVLQHLPLESGIDVVGLLPEDLLEFGERIVAELLVVVDATLVLPDGDTLLEEYDIMLEGLRKVPSEVLH